MAQIRPDDVVLDLGSGDGRIPIDAVARYGAKRGMGIDIDEKLVVLATANAAKAGVGDRVTFVRGDLFEIEPGRRDGGDDLPAARHGHAPRAQDARRTAGRARASWRTTIRWRRGRTTASSPWNCRRRSPSPAARAPCSTTTPCRRASPGSWDVQFIGPTGRQSIPLTIEQRDGRSTRVGHGRQARRRRRRLPRGRRQGLAQHAGGARSRDGARRPRHRRRHRRHRHAALARHAQRRTAHLARRETTVPPGGGSR